MREDHVARHRGTPAAPGGRFHGRHLAVVGLVVVAALLTLILV
jgi:hypothetical protein